MNKRYQLIPSGIALAVGAALFISTTGFASAASLVSNVALESAAVGYATQNGGTYGGRDATSSHIYLVDNISDFKSALEAAEDAPSIIQIRGTIDISNGQSYQNFDDEKARSQLKIPSNTTIIGVDSNAGFINGSLVMSHVNNVIIRNIKIETPVDVAPKYEEGDGWNAEWDSMSVTYSKNIWVDHVTFDDGSFTDADYSTVNGEEYVQHDGELDIKHGSDFVTVSFSVFKNHNKTMLIGHSQSNSGEDAGHLRVTLVDNIFDHIVQRTPRVRFGKVHAFNNVFKGDYKDPTYRYMYSFGLGYEGSIRSENNAFMIDHLKTSKQCKVVSVKKDNSSFSDSGSTFNGSALDLSGCSLPTSNLSWSVPYSYQLHEPQNLDSWLTQNAGASHLSI
ncbi:polysaccharide lyase family 1 protein [Celerinatantimonas sp. YJH-8]|uniref:pectate lyase family protein n=1 Tax=Celerinatantimonas sp. YJH-8 TaxID=3228714 RepID=UPI0038C413C7